MAYDTADILAGARQIRAYLDELVGSEAAQVRARLDELIDRAGDDPKTGTRILALLRAYPAAYEWIRQYLEVAVVGSGGETLGQRGYIEKGSREEPPDYLVGLESIVPGSPDEGLLLGPTVNGPPAAEPPGDRRYFNAELEDHPADEP